MRRNIKKLTAVALTAAMTMGSAMTAFASDLSGDGSYEGGEMKYPAIQVTLPTVPEGIDYIADPNDLITSTMASGDAAKAEYKNYDFNGTTGIYFKTKQASGDAVRGEYSAESAPMTITNENAQDLTVSVTLSKTSDASSAVEYSDTAAFASGDVAKKIYLAVSDGTDAEALSASADATITTDIAGNKNNFEPKYDASTDKYGYVKKTEDGLTWNDATYKLTGAINKAAEWKEDDIVVPNIKVTWKYDEKKTDAAPSIAQTTYALTRDQAVEIPVNLGAGTLKATGLTAANFGTTNFLGQTVTFDAATSKITVNTVAVNAMIGMSGDQTITMVFNDGKTSIPIKFTH